MRSQESYDHLIACTKSAKPQPLVKSKGILW